MQKVISKANQQCLGIGTNWLQWNLFQWVHSSKCCVGSKITVSGSGNDKHPRQKCPMVYVCLAPSPSSTTWSRDKRKVSESQLVKHSVLPCTLKYRINIHVQSAFFFKKSQKKFSHFFPATQKLLLLILLKKESLYEVKPLKKKINKNNFCGAGNKCEIFSCDFLKKIRIVHVRLLGVLKYSWRSVLLRLLQNSRQRCRRDDFPPHFPVMDIGCKGVWDRGKRKSGVAYLLLLASSSPNGKERSLVAAINRLSPPQISFWLLSRNSYSLPSDFCQAKGRA